MPKSMTVNTPPPTSTPKMEKVFYTIPPSEVKEFCDKNNMVEQQSERYVPSNELLKIASEESAPDVERLAKEAEKLALAFHIELRPSEASEEETFQEIRNVLEELVHGAIETFAFRDVAEYRDAHSRTFPVCDSEGKFIPEMEMGISEGLPLQNPKRLLQAIGKDLVSYVTQKGNINNLLYTLYADPSGVHYKITDVVQLPPRPIRSKKTRLTRNA